MTWETNMNSTLLKLNGYIRVSKARCNHQTGGGVALFLKDELKFSVKNITTNTFESLFVEVTDTNRKKTIVGVVYRPPGGGGTSQFLIAS